MKQDIDLSLYLVADRRLCGARGVVETVRAAVRGGVTLVQLRDKEASDDELLDMGRALRAVMAGGRARLIVNDRLEVAVALGADGLHLGQADGDVREARRRLGPRALLGLSARSARHARAADPCLVDYLGIGPVFATATKPDHAAPLGFAGLAEVCAASVLPAVAIGGLRAEHVGAAFAAGAQGLAVVSAICAATDAEAAARSLAMAIGTVRPAAEMRSRPPDRPDQPLKRR